MGKYFGIGGRTTNHRIRDRQCAWFSTFRDGDDEDGSATNKSGIRHYTEEDCKWVDFIKCMRQKAGLPVEALIEYAALFQQGGDTHVTRKQLLIEKRDLLAAKIEEMTKTLMRLDDQIARYEQTIVNYSHVVQQRADFSLTRSGYIW